MQGVLDLNLIHLFTFYLAAAFLLSTVRRLRQYHDVAQLVLAAPNRWPRVLQQIRGHWIMFLTWTTLRPAAIALGLLLVQMICSRLIWPTATLTLRDLLAAWWATALVLIALAAMLAVDLYFIIRVGALDRNETETYLDEAEHWLTSWKAPLIQTITLGYINPRHMVYIEVQKAVAQGRGLLHRTVVVGVCPGGLANGVWLAALASVGRSSDCRTPQAIGERTRHRYFGCAGNFSVTTQA